MGRGADFLSITATPPLPPPARRAVLQVLAEAAREREELSVGLARLKLRGLRQSLVKRFPEGPDRSPAFLRAAGVPGGSGSGGSGGIGGGGMQVELDLEGAPDDCRGRSGGASRDRCLAFFTHVSILVCLLEYFSPCWFETCLAP